MRNLRILNSVFFLIIFFSASNSTIRAQDTITVMQYNLLRYGAVGIGGCTPTGVTARNTWFTNIMSDALPDIFGVNEIGPVSGPTGPWNNILINILQPINPNYKATTITFNGSQDVANMMYYNSEKVELYEQDVIPHSLRDINYYRFYYKGPGLPTGDTTFLEFVLVHLHSSDAGIRETQTAAIMSYLDALGRPGNFVVMGDMNMDGSGAQAFQNMVAHANTDTRLNDPINLSGTWSGNTNAKHAWSQSTRSSSSGDCGSGGGLDDRFDIILCSDYLMNNTDHMSYVSGSYRIFGNPNAPNPAVSSTAQTSLSPMSDHFPVMLQLVVDQATAVEKGIGDEVTGVIRKNPGTGGPELLLDVPSGLDGQYDVSVFDITGNMLCKKEQWLNANRHILIPCNDGMAPGIYYITIKMPTGKRLVLKYIAI